MPKALAAPEQVLHLSQLPSPKDEAAWNRWVTTRTLTVQADELIVIKQGLQTDLVSVPNVASWFVPVAGRFARAAVMHDHLWGICDAYVKAKKAAQEDGTDPPEKPEYDRRQADTQFRAALKEAGVSLLRRRMMWAAVRLNAIVVKKDGGEDWKEDLPALIGLAAVATPILGPPAAVIWVANRAFFALDQFVTWKFDKSRDKNMPTLQTKT